MGNKGSNTTTQTSSTSPSPQAMDAYTQLINRASGVASTPYTPYDGELVAPVNAQQNYGIAQINQNAGFAVPYINQAGQYATNAAQPLTQGSIQQYYNPANAATVGATQSAFDTANKQALNNIKGNEITQGALGGDRNAVAAAAYYGAVSPGQNQTIANLESQNYWNAAGVAQQQQQNQANAAYSLGNLGVAGQNAALQGATAQIGAGSLQQGTQQQLDAAQLAQFQTGQAFPYQQTQWLAGLDTGVGSQMGGTSTGTTTAPPPNPLAQLLGLGVAGVGAFAPSKPAARGGRIRGFAPGGDVGGGFGGTPYAGVGWIPSVQISPGRGAPPLPSGGGGGQQQAGSSNPFGGMNIGQTTAGLRGLGSMFDGSGISTDAAMAGAPLEGTADAFAASTGFAPEAAAGLGDTLAALGPDLAFLALRRGGGIRGFADGGSPDGRGDLLVPSFADRWATLADTPHAPLSADDVAAGSPFTLPDAAHGVPRPTVNYSGGDIDATDINLDADRLGLGSPYSNTNPAIDADAGAPRVGSPDAAPFDQLGHRTAGADVGAGGPLAYGAGYAPPTGDDSPTGAAAAPQAGFGFGLLSPAAKQGLLAAGFGMMASRSPFLGNAIGEGGLAGLNAYSGQKATEFAQEQKKLTTAQANRRLDMEAQRLSQAAEQSRKALDLRTQQVAETAKYHEGMLDRSALKPSGTVTADGHPIMYDARKPGVAFDGVTGEQIKADAKVTSIKPQAGQPTLSPQAIAHGVEQMLAGDYSIKQNLGRGQQASDNLIALENAFAAKLDDLHLTGADRAAATANFKAQTAAAAVAAKREANVSASVEEAKNTFPLALKASAAVPRGQFVPWNKLEQMVQAGTSSPELARFYTATQGAITAYSQAMARTGVSTVDGRHAAEKLLSTATSPEAYAASLGQMDQEMLAAQTAPETVRKAILARISGGTGGNPAQQQGQGAGQADPLADARAAIARGAPRDAVLKRLQEHGIDATGL